MEDVAYLLSKELVWGEILARQARKIPHRTALVAEGMTFTYQEFNSRVNRLSHALLAEGVQRGDKISFVLYNGNEILECYFAAFKIGAVAAPLSYRLVAAEMEYVLVNCEAKVFIYDQELEETIAKIDWTNTVVQKKISVGPDGKYESWISGQEEKEPLIFVDDDDPAVIMYTAGTTGKPKGAVLTHKNLYVQVTNSIILSQGTENDCYYAPSPLFHIAALTGVLPTFFTGAKNVLTRIYRPLETLKLIEREKITGMTLIPTMWGDFLQLKELDKYDTTSLRGCNSGGAIIPVEIKKKIIARWGAFLEHFGQTEMSPSITMLLAEDALRKTTSVGRTMPNVEIRVVDEQDRDVPVGETGEAIYRGPTSMLGYYRAPEATAEAFKGGWFHSGDLIRMDEEGFVYVVGRKKDMIISGGENIYPAEIEDVLYEDPRILEAAVIGLPDPKWGENVVAVVKLKPGMTMTEEEVVEVCAKKLARFKKPKRVFFADLPRSGAGKILKYQMREHYIKTLGLKELK